MALPKKKEQDPVENYEDSEAATVVIDINQFKKELNKASVDESAPVEIEFNVNNSDSEDLPAPPTPEAKQETEPAAETQKTELSLDNFDEMLDDDLDLSENLAKEVVLFDYKSDILSQLHSGQEADDFNFHIVNDLKSLNSLIKAHDSLTIVFYYNQAPKAINTLIKQLNQKFQHIETMIIAKNLSDAKAKAHQQTASGAKHYLSLPESFDAVIEKLK